MNIDDYKIWVPLKKVEPGRFLYHYTTYTTAMKILFYDTLRLSKLSGTNDSLEQRPKLKCFTNDPEFRKNFSKAKNMFYQHQKSIKLLCFSMDPEYNKIYEASPQIEQYLSHDQQYQSVNGRGFALPRMWAQYSENNSGVCLVFEKTKLDKLIKSNKIEVISKPVQYLDYFIPVEISDSDKEIISKIIKSGSNSAILEFIKHKSKFLDYNYFYKLRDWENEHEFRYISFQDNARDDSYILIHGIQKALCGIVLGEKIDEVDKNIMKLFLANQGNGIPLKQLSYCDLTTRILPVLYDND